MSNLRILTYNRTQFVWHQLIIIVFAGLVAASFMFEWVPIKVLRYIAIIVLATQVWLEIKTKQRLLFTSPLFLLSSLSLIFFSFLQGMTVYLSEIPGTSFISAVGSDAERYIAVFAMTTLSTHASILLYIDTNSVTKQIVKIKTNPFILIFFIFAIIILTIAHVSYFYSPLDQTATFYNALRHLSPPLQAFMLVYFIRWCAGNGKKFNLLLALVFCISFAGMFAVGEGKIPIFIGMALLLYWLRLANISIKKTILSAIIFVILAMAGLYVMLTIRSSNSSLAFFLNGPSVTQMSEIPITSNIPDVLKVPVLKLIWRQTDTINCFKNVITTHWDEPFILSKQFFWIKGLMPRIVWPEKPYLSLGQSYSYRYCKKLRGVSHSSSITLLGQAVIQGGWIGLILHAGILIAGLGGITWLSRKPLSLATASTAALLPWLIDFDQNFGMYVANATKFFLVLLPLIFIVGLSEKNQTVCRLTKMFSRQIEPRP